jgi:hypothetical protein
VKLKNALILVSGLIFIITLSSCSKEEKNAANVNSKLKPSVVVENVDTSDPSQVARAAWQAIVKEDYDSYTALLHPASRQRETREQWTSSVQMMKEAPGFQESIKLNIQTVEDPNRSAAVSDDFRVSLGMVFKDGRWWMD